MEKQICNTDRSKDQQSLSALWSRIYPDRPMPGDNLTMIFMLQTAFLSKFIYNCRKAPPLKELSHPTYEKDLISSTQYYIATINNELEEIRELLPWKNHKHYPEDFKVDREELIYEIVDCLHFLINMSLIWQVDPKELMEKYIHKHLINWERQGSGY